MFREELSQRWEAHEGDENNQESNDSSTKPLTGRGIEHSFSANSNPRGRNSVARHDWATSTARDDGKRRGGHARRRADAGERRGRKLWRVWEPEERQSSENGDTAVSGIAP